MTTPIVAQKGALLAEVAAGKTYYWCACGRSANQPFCDGSHKAVGMAPVAYTAEKDAHGLVLRLQAEQERAPVRRDPPEPVSGRVSGSYSNPPRPEEPREARRLEGRSTGSRQVRQLDHPSRRNALHCSSG